MFKHELGLQAKDSVTDFCGIIVGRVEYLTGCRQYLITAKSRDGKEAASSWVDEDRLLITRGKPIRLRVLNPAGPQQNEPPSR